ncbi:MAG TPA: RNase adapter RapZ [Streptomyces sp.]|uniref:RapZ C-terminal domain-containing protein n=1 Tax=Streptomyces sp. TaxID=1931 RepID=UPI002BF30CA1|nr:RNase adapter RapZ [Streptomyces sp.]HWU08449.1 RNase adapter RapZ [Streptomyces sp.]
MTIRIISFGYGHAPAPEADLVFDLRALLRNPFHNPELKHGTGLDQEVYDHVRDTPGAERLAFNAVATARGLAGDTGADVTLAWGCTGGRHRSVGLARLSHELLLGVGEEGTIEHRDVAKALLPAGVHNRPRHTESESIRYTADVVSMPSDGDNYISAQRARIAELQSRPDRLTREDARWLLDRLARADWYLEELRDRIDDAGSLMNTSYVSSALDYTRWSRGTPRGPVTANANLPGPR